jgi:hypothetical protein
MKQALVPSEQALGGLHHHFLQDRTAHKDSLWHPRLRRGRHMVVDLALA